jgi:hypothetical protein
MPDNDYITGERFVKGKQVLALNHGWCIGNSVDIFCKISL